jgi:autotransporter-associated beta strand protein
MTNPYNGGSQAADDFPATTGTADPSYSETLWRVRATSPVANGDNNVLPNGNVSTNAWALFNIASPTAHDGAPQYSQGIELDTSTIGYSNISFSFDWYSTTQGVRDMQFQYCLDTSQGSNAVWNCIGSGIGGAAGAFVDNNSSWVTKINGAPAGTTSLTQIANSALSPSSTYTWNGTNYAFPEGQPYVFVATPNDFYGGPNPQTITVNLSSITGANSDPNFGIRLVSAFDDTGNKNDYVSATLNGGLTQLYNNSSGNWRLGNLTFLGTLGINTNFTGPSLTWNGGSGAWDKSTPNWSGASTMYADGSVVTFGNVSSGTSMITISGGTLSPGGVIVSNSTPNTGYVFLGGVTGGTGGIYLTANNAGFLSLSGTNTYAGGTQVSGGTLIVAGDACLGAVNGAGGALVIDNNSTLQLASNLTSGRTFEIGSNGGVLNTQGFSFSTSGSFIGGGNYSQLGSGTVTLSGLSAQLSGSTSIAPGSTLVLSGSNAASLQGGAAINGNLVINGPTRVNFDNNLTSGMYAGSGTIQVAYPGSVTPSKPSNATNAWAVIADSPVGASTAANGTVVSGGTIANNIVLNSGNLPFTKSNVAATFAFSTTGSFIVGIGGTTPGNVLAITGNISGNSDVVLGSNTINGAGGAGTLFLSGNNTWAGTTMIDGNGVIQLGSSASLPAATDVIFGATDTSSGTLDLNGFNQTINSLSTSTGTGSITNSNATNAATLTITGGLTPKTGFNGFISGNLALYKTGSGGLTLSGSSTYTGATTIAQGIVTVSNASALGVGPLSVLSGGGLVYSGAAVSLANNSASFAAGTSLSTGGTASYGTLAVNSMTLSGGSLTYDFNSTQSDLITGTGILDLSGATAHSIVVNLNTSGQTFNSYPLLTFASLNGFNSSDFAIGSGTKAGYAYGFVQDGTNPNQIDLTITGTGSNNLPSRQSLTWATSSGAWNSTATNWGGSATYVDGDTVTFPEPTVNNSTVTITASSAVSPQSLTFSNMTHSYNITGGSIAGTTALNMTGAGLVTLSNSNSYTGGTFITGGTLATGPSGDAALGASTGGVTLDTNGTLQFTSSNVKSSRAITVNPGGGTIVASSGTASMSGNLTVAANGTLNTAGPGILAFTGGTKTSVALGAGSTLSVQSGTLAVIPENFTDNGQLTVASSATLYMVTQTATSAASGSVTLGNATINGNLAVSNPLTVQFPGGVDLAGSGSLQFQNMQTPAAPTHFTTASAQGITMTGQYVTSSIDCNIQLNTTNQTFFKTSVSQSGSIANGNGFILGNGTTDSFFWIYPSSGNSLYLNGVISGNCDVQLGEVGGGGGASSVYLNAQNTYTGVTMFEQGVQGNVYLGVKNALPTTTDLIFAPINGNSYQQTLELYGNNQAVASLSYWADANGDGTSNAVTVQNTVGVATLTVSGAASPSRPYGGLLADGNGGSGGTLILVKDGPNTLWLNNGHNSYVGGTTVQNGLLLLSPTDMGTEPQQSSVTGYGDVTVNGGTLQGTATIQGNLNVNGGAMVRPGTVNPLVAALAQLNIYSTVPCAPGGLAVEQNATFASGANLQYDFASNGASSLSAGNIALSTTGSVAVKVVIGGLGGNGTTVYPIMLGNLTNGYSAGMLTLGAHSTSFSYSFSSPNSSEIDLSATYLGSANLTWIGGNGNFWGGAIGEFLGGMSDGSLGPSNNGDILTFSDSAGANGSITMLGSVSPGSMTFSNTATTYSLSGGSITGNGSLLVNGQGAVNLGGTNSYSGGTTVQSGTLTATTAGAIPARSSVANSGTFNVSAGPQVIGAITGNGSFNVTGSATVSAQSIVQESASIASNATLNLTGPGAVANSLTLANSGNLNITGGTHTMASLNASGSSSLPLGTTTVSNGTLVTANLYQATLNVNSGGTIVLDTPAGVNNNYNGVTKLNMSGGLLDLQASGLYVADGGTAATAVTAAIFSAIQQGSGQTVTGSGVGLGNVTWKGASGITSSTLAAVNSSIYGVGFVTNYNGGGYTLIETALLGDAGLTGKVTAADVGMFYGPSSAIGKTNVAWAGGDFYYQGYVGANDRNAALRNQGSFGPAIAINNGTALIDYNSSSGLLDLVVTGNPELDNFQVYLPLANPSLQQNNIPGWETNPAAAQLAHIFEWDEINEGTGVAPGTYVLADLGPGLPSSDIGSVTFGDFGGNTTSDNVQAVPEPGTLTLALVAGLVSLGACAMRRRRGVATKRAANNDLLQFRTGVRDSSLEQVEYLRRAA